MPATKKSNPLICYKCKQGDKLSIGDDVVLRRRKRRGEPESKRLPHVNINCRRDGHEWWSMHPEAIRIARKKDADREKFHEQKVAAAQ